MTCEACRSALASSDDRDINRQRAERVDSVFPHCACERFSASHLSSGVVGEDEILLRILVAPTHMTKKGERPRASCLTEAETSGLSMLRKSEASNEQIRAVATARVLQARRADTKHPERAGVFGVLEIHCGSVRAFRQGLEADTAYCVYDTAEPDLECHVEAMQKVAGVSDEVRQARRTGLFSLLQASFVPVGEFRDGLLLDLAPHSEQLK